MRTALCCIALLAAAGCAGGSPAGLADSPDTRFAGQWSGSNALIALDFPISTGHCPDEGPLCFAGGRGTFTKAGGQPDSMVVDLIYAGDEIIAVHFRLPENTRDPVTGLIISAVSRFVPDRVSPSRWEGKLSSAPLAAGDDLFGLEDSPIVLLKQ